MPVVHVRARDLTRDTTGRLLDDIAQAIADAVGGDIRGVWCTFTPFTLGTIGRDEPDDEDAIVYVDVLLKPRGSETNRKVLEAVGRAVAGAVPVKHENVWARIVELPAGAVLNGGTVR